VHGGLTRRTILASGVLAIIIGAAFAGLLQALARESSSAELAQHSAQVLAAAQRLERLELDLEAAQRDFVITGDQHYLRSWNAARGSIPGASASLVQMTVVPAHRSSAREIAAAVSSYVTKYSVPLVTTAQGKPLQARAQLVQTSMQRREDALRRLFDRFTAEEQAFSAARQRTEIADARTATTVGIAGLAGSMVLIVAFGAYLTRAIVLPIRRGAAMASRLADGDLSARMPETGAGEIGELEHAFNAMGESLQASRADLHQLAVEQSALRRVATLVARDVHSHELLGAVVDEVDRVLGASSTQLARYTDEGAVTIVMSSRPDDVLPVGASWPADGDHLAGQVYRTGRPARWDTLDDTCPDLADVLRSEGVRSAIAAPILAEGRLWGTMLAYWTDRVPPPDTEARLEEFTGLIATAIANAASRAALTASRARVVETADETRRCIERDLHDGAQQRLVHTVVSLKLARRALAPIDGAGSALVEEALAHAERANTALRELVQGILPAALNRGGLRAGVEALVASAPIDVDLDITRERMSRRLEATAYFIIAEALTNVFKHSGADSATVRAVLEGDALHMEVRDDGTGGARLEGSTGLLGLHDRAAAVGGELHVDSPRGGGTTVTAVLPLTES
jgi:signal transduction histidine kinase